MGDLAQRPVIAAPLFAAWSLGNIIGFPALLLAAGYLAEKGHVTFLGVPTGLLSSRTDYLFYEGAQWFLLTLQTITFSWVALIAAGCGVAVYSFRARVRRLQGAAARWVEAHPRLTRLREKLLGIEFWMAVSVAILVLGGGWGMYFLGHSSSRLTGLYAKSSAMSSPESVQTPDLTALVEDPSEGGFRKRETVYRRVSWLGLAASALAVWLLQTPGYRPRAGGSMMWNAFYAIALVACASNIVQWPLCYGRLMLPYNRPVIAVEKPERVIGFVLNPHGDVWTIWPAGDVPRSSTIGVLTLEVKSLARYQIIGYKNLFDSSAPMVQRFQVLSWNRTDPAGQQKGATTAPLPKDSPAPAKEGMLDRLAKLLFGTQTKVKYIDTLNLGERPGAKELRAFVWERSAKQVRSLNAPTNARSPLLHCRAKQGYYLLNGHIRQQALTPDFIFDSGSKPVSIIDAQEFTALIGFVEQNARQLLAITPERAIVRIDLDNNRLTEELAPLTSAEVQQATDESISSGGAAVTVESPRANEWQILLYPKGEDSPAPELVRREKGMVLMDPRWSEDGSRISFVQGPRD